MSTRDPQVLVTQFAKWSAGRVVPTMVALMAAIDAGLLSLALLLLYRWFVGWPLLVPSQISSPVHADTVLPGVRLALEWFEVMGPAVAFALMVLGLIIAFDPAVFADHGGSTFSATVSQAMTVTFVGLLMRVLAFSNDRLIHHLSWWHADDDGFVRPYADDTRQREGRAESPPAEEW